MGLQPGILRDKTMDDRLMYKPNDYKQIYPFSRLKFLVEKDKTVVTCLI